jgi:hypothetical protein
MTLPERTLLSSSEQANQVRASKTRTTAVRVTESEYVPLQQEAYERNQTVSEWGRNKALRAWFLCGPMVAQLRNMVANKTRIPNPKISPATISASEPRFRPSCVEIALDA